MPLLLTRRDVESLLTMRAAINIVETALREWALGHVKMPPQTTLHLSEYESVYRITSALFSGQIKGFGFQVLASCPDNPQRHRLPRAIGTLMLSDPETGVPLAIMDTSFLTAMSSGAISAVATKYLARREVNEVAIFGAGDQARTQLMGVCSVRKVNGVLVLDPDPQARHLFADHMSKALGIPIEPVQDVRAAVEMADVIITASSVHSRYKEGKPPGPLFQGEWLQPGVHVNAVGAHRPDTREVDTATVRRATVILDLTSACLVETGDLIIPLQEGAITQEHIHADLGQVIAGQKPGRESDAQITLFKSVGVAIQDVATAVHVYNLARRRRVGKEFDL